jgi:multidrug resistance efflux pump
MAAKRIGLILAVVAVAAVLAAWLLRPHNASPDRVNPIVSTGSQGHENPASLLTGRAPSTGERPNHSLNPAAPKSSDETLNLLGSVQSAAQATLTTRIPLRIVAVLVKEGAAVQRGQLLVRLDDEDIRAQERAARSAIATAQAQVDKALAGRKAQKVKANADVLAAQNSVRLADTRLQQARLARQAAEDDQKAELKTAQEGVRKAQIALDRAQQTLHDLEELAKVGGVSRSELEGARTQVKVAQSDLETAKAQAQRLQAGSPGGKGLSYRVELAQKDLDAVQEGLRQANEGVRTAEEGRKQALALADQDIATAKAGLAQAQAGLISAQKGLTQTRLVSPIQGVAASVGAHVGETAQPGVPLVTVVSLSGLRVEALVPARLLSALKVGRAAKIAVDTQPGKSFPAVVSEISRIAEPDGRTFRVKFRLLDPNSLRPGQSARITVPPA